MRIAAVLVFLLGVVRVRSADKDTSAINILSRAVDTCSGDTDVYSCLKTRAVKLLDEVLAVESLSVSDYISITKDSQSVDPSAAGLQTKEELEATLPRDLGQKSSTLDKMILERLNWFLKTRVVRLNIPKDVFEGRGGYKGKYKGKGDKGIFLLFGAFAAMLLQVAYTKIALIAGKALLVSKVALLLAGVIGLRSLLKQGHGESHPQVIYTEPEHHGGWGRSLGVGDEHDLAYRGHRLTVTSS